MTPVPADPWQGHPLREEVERLRKALQMCIPWVASSGRGAAQEALAAACELVGYNAFGWTAHPDVLLQRRPDLERRKAAREEKK